MYCGKILVRLFFIPVNAADVRKMQGVATAPCGFAPVLKAECNGASHLSSSGNSNNLVSVLSVAQPSKNLSLYASLGAVGSQAWE